MGPISLNRTKMAVSAKPTTATTSPISARFFPAELALGGAGSIVDTMASLN
jgi:hypothetical protein